MKDSKTSGTPERGGNSTSHENAGKGVDNPSPPPAFYSSPFFVERGISPEVAAARGYREWGTTKDLIDYCKTLPGVSKVQVSNIATQSPCGFFIPRSYRGVEMSDPRFPVYLPELKPTGDEHGLGLDGEKFEGVRTGSLRGNRRYYHAHPTEKRSFPPKMPNGKKLPMRSYHAAADMQNHIDRDKCPGDHAGVPDEHVHSHLQDPAKYVFLKGKLNGKALSAKCLDVHSLAPPFRDVRRVYVGMEGCPKADAMLTAILATGEPSSAGSIAAVTHWKVKELHAWVTRFLMEPVSLERLENGDYAMYRAPFRSQEIVLVPDADGYLNERVRQQALFFRTELRRYGLVVLIAAPPIPAHIRAQGKQVVKHWLETEGAKGVDDFLGPKHGGKLADLDVLHRELPVNAFDAWALNYKFRHGLQERRVRRDRKFLEGLSLHGTDEGTFSGSLRTLAATVGLSKDAAYRAAHALEEAGVIELDKPLILAPKSFEMTDPKTGKKTGEWFTEDDFLMEDRPTFTLPEELRCPPDTFRPLGEPLTYPQLLDRVTHLEIRVNALEGRAEAVEDRNAFTDAVELAELLGTTDQEANRE